METKKTLRGYLQTRRFTGRRGITPMRSKHKIRVTKTRGHKVERRNHVPILKHTSSQQHGERKEDDKDEHSENTQRQGNQDSCDERKWEDQKEHTQVKQRGNTENSEESVHPGALQAMCGLSEQQQLSAEYEASDKTQIEAEELTP